MRRVVFLIVPLLALMPALAAADSPKEKPKEKPKTEKPASAAEQFGAIDKELEALKVEAEKQFEEAKTRQEKQKIVADYQKKLRDKIRALAPRILELVGQHPANDKALGSLYLVMNFTQGTPSHDKAVVLLRKVAEKNSKKEIQVQATFLLAKKLKEKSESPDTNKADGEKAAREAEELYAKIEEKYADVNKDITEQAKTELFELRNLAIGKTPPDIEAEDADGNKFKLSDYRGKVVVLDFWAEW